MGLREILDRHLPHDDARRRLAPAAVIGVVVRNLVTHREPVYALGEWAAPYDPALLGLDDPARLNDDRVGRTLERLFDADRASALTELMLGVIRAFDIGVSQLHNDSTTVTFTGGACSPPGGRRGGKALPGIAFGHNKDHRPDLRQLVWILTVSADGAVPVAYRVADGNTSDDVTHIPAWEELVALVGGADFLCVADCKLASRGAMAHIHQGGGRFVTVLPRTRKEDGWFRRWAQTNSPEWTEAARHAGSRANDPEERWHTFVAPVPSAEGHRIIWVNSTSKGIRDAESRAARIHAGVAAMDVVSSRLAGPSHGCGRGWRPRRPPARPWTRPERGAG